MKPSSSSRPAPRPMFSFRRFVPAALALAPIAVLPPGHALPTGAQVAAGTVDVAQAGTAMTLTQSSRHAIVNWQSFGLGAGESLRLAQPGADAAMLARVTGSEASQLLGSLHADGKLFLINPKGIVVGRDAVIDTAGFVASTHDVGDADFLRGTDLVFKGDSAAGIVNLGTIRAREGGLFLFAHTVNNAGTLAAEKGTAGLGAGTEFHLVSADAPTFTVRLNLASSAAKTGVDNAGVVAAARAQLEAAGGSLYDLAVNQSGVVRATGVENKNGRVLLTAAGGTVGVSGQVVARNADGSGGEILVGGDFQGKNAAVANAARTVVTATATLDASAANPGAKAGRAVVWADDATRFLGTLEATGAGGGFAEISGKRWLDFNPAAPVQLGREGTLLLDPDALVVGTGASSGTSTGGTNPFVFGATTQPATLNVTTLQNQLALTNVTLDTSTSGGDITVNTAVTWATDNTLRLQAGGNINLNANIAGGAAATLALYPGREAAAPGESGLRDIAGDATLLSGATVTVGTLTFGANAAAAPAGGYTLTSPARGGILRTYGNLSVGTLQLDLAGGQVGVSTEGSNNAIGAFRTTGTGALGTTYVVDHQGGLDVTLATTASDTAFLQFITPGALTLKSGSSVNFPTSGTVVLASTGGAFANQAGASVFGANARYLIYTSTPAATTRGGLAPTYVFNTAFDKDSAPSPYTEDALSRIIYAGSRATLTLTAASATRLYGDANPTFSVGGSGFVDGDTLASAVTGSAAFSTAATAASGVGNYTITTAAGTLASSFYALAFAPGTLTVNKAPLTVSVSTAMTKNQGAANPNFTNFTSATGLKLTDTLAAAVPDLAFTTAATTASPAGTYAVSVGGTSANYALTFNAGTLTVAAGELPLLTYAANNLTRTYGDANPAFTFTRAGLVSGVTDDVTGAPALSTAATQSSGAGTYTIGIAQGTLASANYRFAFTPGTLTVDKAPLTATIANASRAPNAANPAFNATYAGLKNGDTAAVIADLAFTTTATTASPSGTYPINGTGTAANYTLTFVQGTLTIGGILNYAATNAARTYGAANPAFAYTVSGLLAGDSLASVVSGAPALSTTATQSSGAGTYAIDIARGTLSSPSYGFAFTPGTLMIDRAPLTIAANNAARTYGAANPAFGATFAGLVNSDTAAVVSGLGFATSATAASGVGSYAITPSGGTAANYALSYVPGTLTIDRAPLTIAANNAARTYGAANPAFGATFSGLVNGDTAAVVSGLGFATSATAVSGVGSYAITPGGGTAANYALSYVPGTLTIGGALLTFAANNAVRAYGSPNPTFGYGVTGFVGADTAATAFTGAPAVATTATQLSGVGTYAISIARGTLAAANYDFAFKPGTLTIDRAPLTITANNAARTYGAANPVFGATYAGLVNGDTAAVVSGLSLATPATAASGVGSYAITPAGGAAANYALSYVPGTLTVNRAPLTITANNAARTYGAANPVFGATYAGLVNGDTSAVLSGLSFATPATAASGVGSYAITPAGGAAANYALSYMPGTLTVNRAPLTAFIASASRGFGGANAPFFFGSFDGLVNGDTAGVLSGVAFGTDAGIAAIPGTYPITGSASAANYAVTVVPGLLTVTRAPFFAVALSATGTVGSVAAGYPVFGVPAPVAGGPQFTVAAAAAATNSSPAGVYALTPVITRTDGLPPALLDLYYDVRLAPGTLTLRNPPTPTVLTGLQPTQLGSPAPITLNTGTNTINRDVTITPNQQIEVVGPQSLSLGIVMRDTRPLTRADYAGYFGTFSATMSEVRSTLKVGYDKFLQGYGKSGTAYAAMSPEGRALLARWMAGGISDADFQAMIAAGVAGANEAFGFILPTLVEKTRAKDAAQMTAADRQILGRLADLTEKQRADTVRIAQEKYQKMLADQATMASTGTLNVVFRGPGDFQEIVQSARQEALAAGIGIAAGTGALATAAGTIALQLVPVLNAIFIHEGSTAAAIGGAGAVPAIIIFFVTTLASRSIQMNESLKNEQAFHDFIGSFRDEQITSIAQLKSPAMSEELKLSTLLLSAEFLATSRP